MSIFHKFHKDWAKIGDFLLGHSDFENYSYRIMTLTEGWTDRHEGWNSYLDSRSFGTGFGCQWLH